MRVVIAGGGSVGKFIAESLHKGGHEVLIVDNDAAVVRRAVAANEPPGVPWMKADACEVSRLAEAGVDKADVVAAVTGDDEDNLVVSLLAKQEFGVPARRRSGQQPEERVDVQRELGRRRRGVDSSPADRARGRGGFGRHLRAHPVVRGRPGATCRGHAGRHFARGRQGDRRPRSCPETRPSSQCCDTTTSSCLVATPCCGSATRCSCSSPTTPRPTCAPSSPAPEASPLREPSTPAACRRG